MPCRVDDSHSSSQISPPLQFSHTLLYQNDPESCRNTRFWSGGGARCVRAWCMGVSKIFGVKKILEGRGVTFRDEGGARGVLDPADPSWAALALGTMPSDITGGHCPRGCPAPELRQSRGPESGARARAKNGRTGTHTSNKILKNRSYGEKDDQYGRTGRRDSAPPAGRFPTRVGDFLKLDHPQKICANSPENSLSKLPMCFPTLSMTGSAT